MKNIAQYYNSLKETDEAVTNLFDTITTIFSLRILQLQKLILTVQAIAANIEGRIKKYTIRYIKLLDFIEQYKEEEEARAMIDLDYQILKRYYMEIKSEIDNLLSSEGLRKSNKLAVDILKGYNEV